MAFKSYDKLTWCLENGVPVGEERDYMKIGDGSDMVRKYSRTRPEGNRISRRSSAPPRVDLERIGRHAVAPGAPWTSPHERQDEASQTKPDRGISREGVDESVPYEIEGDSAATEADPPTSSNHDARATEVTTEVATEVTTEVTTEITTGVTVKSFLGLSQALGRPRLWALGLIGWTVGVSVVLLWRFASRAPWGFDFFVFEGRGVVEEARPVADDASVVAIETLAASCLAPTMDGSPRPATGGVGGEGSLSGIGAGASDVPGDHGAVEEVVSDWSIVDVDDRFESRALVARERTEYARAGALNTGGELEPRVLPGSSSFDIFAPREDPRYEQISRSATGLLDAAVGAADWLEDTETPQGDAREEDPGSTDGDEDREEVLDEVTCLLAREDVVHPEDEADGTDARSLSLVGQELQGSGDLEVSGEAEQGDEWFVTPSVEDEVDQTMVVYQGLEEERLPGEGALDVRDDVGVYLGDGGAGCVSPVSAGGSEVREDDWLTTADLSAREGSKDCAERRRAHGDGDDDQGDDVRSGNEDESAGSLADDDDLREPGFPPALGSVESVTFVRGWQGLRRSREERSHVEGSELILGPLERDVIALRESGPGGRIMWSSRRNGVTVAKRAASRLLVTAASLLGIGDGFLPSPPPSCNGVRLSTDTDGNIVLRLPGTQATEGGGSVDGREVVVHTDGPRGKTGAYVGLAARGGYLCILSESGWLYWMSRGVNRWESSRVTSI